MTTLPAYEQIPVSYYFDTRDGRILDVTTHTTAWHAQIEAGSRQAELRDAGDTSIQYRAVILVVDSGRLDSVIGIDWDAAQSTVWSDMVRYEASLEDVWAY